MKITLLLAASLIFSSAAFGQHQQLQLVCNNCEPLKPRPRPRPKLSPVPPTVNPPRGIR